MLKILVLLLYLLPGSMQPLTPTSEDCNCPPVTNLQKAWQTSSAYTLSWTANSAAAGYIVKYTREEDSYASQAFYTSSSTFTFNNLPAGHYQFNVAADCGSTTSDFVGIEDVIEN
ncbi:MAG: fibronectin type III domain-containing protein [Saprospiraceae bacterium]|nr:fibronectin type III domain-containing protein [Saprospiraceae bacterium]MCF8251101.1 fibronectin type III domain-containing protein [Saprospiraceae bacterium]MCF8281003.1 fibronectin type III domain-containing protein [Bacteroidales bacterium]MCF8312941.1 fibronectin type III domain-containing protein [Saprospiraceae bacterium]MCF8441360.1 fibronectin type III domain-containing protein [Saprospiraceae bacterium]